MAIVVMLHGRQVRKVGTRYFAIPKSASLTDRIARHATATLRPSWDKIMDSPLGGHVIINQKRADGRRAAKWSKNVTPALFAGRR